MSSTTRACQFAPILFVLALALAGCESPRPTPLSTPAVTPSPAATATATPLPTAIPLPTPTPTPTPRPGERERAALEEAVAAVGWKDPVYGEEPAYPPQRVYHSWSVAVLVTAGADRIMEVREYPDEAAAARWLGYERGATTAFHNQPARRSQTTSVQYGRTANMDTLVWQSGARLFWVRDANNSGGQATALPLAEALRAAAGRHGLTAPPPVVVTRDLSAQGTASGFAVSLRVQTDGTNLPARVVVEEQFSGADLADALGAEHRHEADGTWRLSWDLRGDAVKAGELTYLVMVPCSAMGVFQARGTVTYTVADETVAYPITGDAVRSVAGPTCTPTMAP